MIINKKWCANKGQYFVWFSPSNSGPDYDGVYWDSTNPGFSDLSGDHLVVGRLDVPGEFVSTETPPSSLWDFDIYSSQVFPSATIDGHTGLWAIDVDTNEISPTEYTPKFKDIFWAYLAGEIQLRSTQDNMSEG
jgi:hypothetical protein